MNLAVDALVFDRRLEVARAPVVDDLLLLSFCPGLDQSELGGHGIVGGAQPADLAGYLSGFFDSRSPETLMKLYGGIAVGLLICAGILAALTPTVRRLMGGVR